MPDFRAAYDLVALRCSVPNERSAVWFVDLNGPRSVANDAERVCADVNALYRQTRIFYRDTDGYWDELVHDDGRFLRFTPARFAGVTRGGPIVDFEEPRRG